MEKDTLAEVSFGEWLKRRRKAAGWTQEQLALKITCSTSALRKFEAEERFPSAQIIEKLAEVFDISSTERVSFLRFARGDWESAPAWVMEDEPWRVSSKSLRSNLPASLTSLIGREQQVADVREYLSDLNTRLVTLIGPPGIGKTRLSLEVARAELAHFPDGVFFVALAPLEDSSLVAPTIAQTLDFVKMHNLSPFQRLKDGIGDKQMLIVLDNVEHLIEGTATLVSNLLLSCPHLKILNTSREALRVPGEWLYSIPPLNIPRVNSSIEMEAVSQFSALTLFAERARAVRSDFVLKADNIEAVTMICAQLDGLPLAIELIAARARLMSPQTLLTKLNDLFVLHADGMRAVSARQKTLHNTISWSYNLLTEPEQILFCRLAIFVGGFTLEAAKVVCGQDELKGKDIFDLLGRLIDKSLVIIEVASTSNETRYRLLETIREYALEKLNNSDEMTMICLRHLRFFAEMVDEAERNFKGPDQAIWYKHLDHELDNLRAALTWFEGSENAEIRLRFAAGLWRYWKSRGQSSEGRKHLQNILEALPPGSSRQTLVCARALTAAGSLAYYEGDFSYSEQSRVEALAIFRNPDDKVGIADCLNGLGNTAISQGNYDAARRFYEESLTIRKDLEDRWGVARVLGNLGLLAYFQTDYIQAHFLHSESLTLFKELRDDEGIANELVNLGDVARHQGELPTALSLYQDSASISQKLKDQWGLAYAIMGIADVVFEQGDVSKAFLLYGECLTMFQEEADYIGLPYALEAIAALALVKNQWEKAARIFSAADALRQSTHTPMPLPNYSTYQKNLSSLQQQLDRSKFESVWTEGRAMTIEQTIAYALESQNGEPSNPAHSRGT
jgi:predicted ATPase/DNA-binding XRE family transcriptional regulator